MGSDGRGRRSPSRTRFPRHEAPPAPGGTDACAGRRHRHGTRTASAFAPPSSLLHLHARADVKRNGVVDRLRATAPEPADARLGRAPHCSAPTGPRAVATRWHEQRAIGAARQPHFTRESRPAATRFRVLLCACEYAACEPNHITKTLHETRITALSGLCDERAPGTAAAARSLRTSTGRLAAAPVSAVV